MNSPRKFCLGSAPAPGAAGDAPVAGTDERKSHELFQPPSCEEFGARARRTAAGAAALPVPFSL